MTVFSGEAESLRPKSEEEKPPRTTFFVYLLTVLSAVGGFLFGYDTGVVSGAMLLVKNEFGLTHEWHELIVSITIATAWLFSLIGGYAGDKFGRKPTILSASFIFTVGAVVMGVARDKETLLAGRAVVGAGIGFASTIVPMYIAEVAPTAQRGKLVTLNNAFITGGCMVAGLLCGALSYEPVNGWRYMLGLSGIPAVIQFIGFLGMPESPRWLISRGYTDRALETLRSIREKGTSIEEEYEAIVENCRETESQQKTLGNKSILVSIFTTPTVRRALFLGCWLQIFQQLSGINTVMYYSAPIVKMSGVTDDTLAIWLAAATACVNFFATFIGLYLVEKIGRRPLTLGSLLGSSLTLIVLACGFQLTSIYSPPVTIYEPYLNVSHCSTYTTCSGCTNTHDCGFCFIAGSTTAFNGSCVRYDMDDPLVSLNGRCAPLRPSQHSMVSSHGSGVVFAPDWCPSNMSWLIVVGMVLYLLFFAPGMGPMPWTVNSEIYPLWARSTCYSISTSCCWLGNLVVSMTFLTFTELLTKEGTFYMYAGLAFIGFVVLYFIMPETRGCTLEDVEGLFAKSWLSKKSAPPSKTIHYHPEDGAQKSYQGNG